ncbi:hypothetical protein [Sphingomonas sp. PP-CE-1G-424]|nr:hypothetical protein [Sphingomonas sp. PP-CE-1G-424]
MNDRFSAMTGARIADRPALPQIAGSVGLALAPVGGFAKGHGSSQ